MSGSSKRYGVRYGRRLRLKLEAVEEQQKTKYKCPYCHKVAVRRQAVGIWNCPKCSALFTGRAYTIPKKPGVEECSGELLEEAPEEEIEEEHQEEEEQQEEQTA